MENYHDLYLKVDVLSLVCVFETYNWCAMLKFTDVSLKLISDIEKYQFIESMIKNGVSMSC